MPFWLCTIESAYVAKCRAWAVRCGIVDLQFKDLVALHLCTLLWDVYTLKQLYVWLINVCSMKIFICGFGLQFVILCKVHHCLSRRP